MPYIFLFTAVVCSAILSITATVFNKSNKKNRNFSDLYNLIVTFSSFAVWSTVFIKDLKFTPVVLIYSFGFGIFYVLAFVGLFNAMGCGSPSLTSFIKQLSLIIVSVWGFLFWNNPISSTVLIGLVLVMVALWFCFKPDKSAHTTLKWILYTCLVIVGNAGCSIVQKYQQIRFDGNYGSLLMFGATATSFLICLVLNLRRDGPRLKEFPRFTFLLPIAAGISSAVLNLAVLRLIASSIPESVFFPIIGVGGIVFTTLFSVIVYKEKLTFSRCVGLVIGIVAIVFLNI